MSWLEIFEHKKKPNTPAPHMVVPIDTTRPTGTLDPPKSDTPQVVLHFSGWKEIPDQPPPPATEAQPMAERTKETPMSSFFKAIKSWWSKHFASNNTIVNDFHIAASAIQVIAPGVVLALQQANQTGAATEVGKVTNEVITDLGTLSSLFAKGQAGQTGVADQIMATLNSITANIKGLLAAGHIKDPKLVTEITNVTTAIDSEAQVIYGMFETGGLLAPPAKPAA
jgi:hypothetical protein